MTERYILDERGEPVPEPNLHKWGAWMQEQGRRIVASDHPFPWIHVSTVFLGLDHNFTHVGQAVLYETMVFGGPFGGGPRHGKHFAWVGGVYRHTSVEWQTRCCTREEALVQHAEALALGHGRAIGNRVRKYRRNQRIRRQLQSTGIRRGSPRPGPCRFGVDQ